MIKRTAIGPRKPEFPTDDSSLPAYRYALRNSFEIHLRPSINGSCSFSGMLIGDTREGETHRYIFEGTISPSSKITSRISTADPDNSLSFDGRNKVGESYRFITGMPEQHRKDLRDRIRRTAQYAFDSFLAEQEFLGAHFDKSDEVLGATTAYDGRTLEIRRFGDWIIERESRGGGHLYSAHSLRSSDALKSAAKRLENNKNRRLHKY